LIHTLYDMIHVVIQKCIRYQDACIRLSTSITDTFNNVPVAYRESLIYSCWYLSQF